MLHFSKKSEVKKAITAEKEIVGLYVKYEETIKETIEKYLKEAKSISFDNEALKTMLFNNFENATVQIDNNLADIESLSNVLDILESQKDVSTTDTETYNKLAQKSVKNMELTQNFIQQTLGCFENVTITGKKKAIDTIEECKSVILEPFPFAEIKEQKEEKSNKSSIKNLKAIKKTFDYSSSDLLCFFPKTKEDNLVISTVQDNYKISFKNSIATISIDDENFNISLATSGVQISNSNTNNILFVSHSDDKYTIITNNQIEIPFFIHVSKVNKNEDFLEIEITKNSLVLRVEDNILNFEEDEAETQDVVETKIEAKVEPKVETKVVSKFIPAKNIILEDEDSNADEEDVDNSEEAYEESEGETDEDVSPTEVVVPTAAVEPEEVEPEEIYEPEEITESFVAATPIIQNQEEVIDPNEEFEEASPSPSKNKHGKHSKSETSKAVNKIVENKIENQKAVKKQLVAQDVILPGVNDIVEDASSLIDPNNITDNDTLIISDANKTVILPYKVADLQKKMQKSKKYKTIKDVLDNEYTIPLDTFKNPVKSRFREAFQLIKNKEHGSLKEAVGLGLELMFQSNLNPAVIAACRDLDELDIYLDCLDDNELEKFNCFKISYSVPPAK